LAGITFLVIEEHIAADIGIGPAVKKRAEHADHLYHQCNVKSGFSDGLSV
jgi:hypothetical protein